LLVITSPTVRFLVIKKDGGKEDVYTPSKFPDHGTYEKVLEPWAHITLIIPSSYVGALSNLIHMHEGNMGESHTLSDTRVSLLIHMPLRELMRNFFDEVKSISQGYASISYVIEEDLHEAKVVRLDILLAGERVPALCRIVSARRVDKEARNMVERLKNIVPRQQFVLKIQAETRGRIIASRTLSALRKDVTGPLYGGDVTRKKKLLEAQKKGKKKLKSQGRVNLPHEVFIKIMRS